MLTTLLLACTLSPLSHPTPIIWQTDFLKASMQAKNEKKDLVIHFRKDDTLDGALAAPEVTFRLKKFVCVRLPLDYVYKGQRMLDREALAPMIKSPGICVVSRHDDHLPYHDQIISAHPLVSSEYRWVPALGERELAIILDLPDHATLSQRSLIYAITVHPDAPKSVKGLAHPALLNHAEKHSGRQAAQQHQHHADLGQAMHWIGSQVGGISGAAEVVAESWGGEHVLEAAFSCVDAWRHSTGHWGAIKSEHRFFGYDIIQSASGTWYATGIFAD